MNGWIVDQIVITHDVGLHARPSVKLTKLAKGYGCRIEIASDASGPWIDAKSIVKVMALKAKQNRPLHIRAQGEAAEEAVIALKNLIARDFDEDKAHAAES
jgi:phosphocarrier protein